MEPVDEVLAMFSAMYPGRLSAAMVANYRAALDACDAAILPDAVLAATRALPPTMVPSAAQILAAYRDIRVERDRAVARSMPTWKDLDKFPDRQRPSTRAFVDATMEFLATRRLEPYLARVEALAVEYPAEAEQMMQHAEKLKALYRRGRANGTSGAARVVHVGEDPQ